jgi:hypothetical protein
MFYKLVSAHGVHGTRSSKDLLHVSICTKVAQLLAVEGREFSLHVE